MNIIAKVSPLVRALAEEAEREGMVFDDSHKPPPPKSGKGGPKLEEEGWEPGLTETGRRLFYCDKPFMLAHGERGGGKTEVIFLDALADPYPSYKSASCFADIVRVQIEPPAHLLTAIGGVETRDRIEGLYREYIDKIYAPGRQPILFDPYYHPVLAQLARKIKPKPRFDYAAWLNRIHGLSPLP